MMRLKRTPSFRLLSSSTFGELSTAPNFDGGMYHLERLKRLGIEAVND